MSKVVIALNLLNVGIFVKRNVDSNFFTLLFCRLNALLNDTTTTATLVEKVLKIAYNIEELEPGNKRKTVALVFMNGNNNYHSEILIIILKYFA